MRDKYYYEKELYGPACALFERFDGPSLNLEELRDKNLGWVGTEILARWFVELLNEAYKKGQQEANKR